MKTLLIRIGNILFHHRNRVFPVFMVGGVLVFRPSFPWNSYSADLWLDIAGVVVCFVGQALRIATVGFDYIKRGGKGKRIWADRLVRGGMFAHSRNPLYLGNVLIFIGAVMILHSLWAYIIGIPAVLFVYLCVVMAEEQFLAGRFGAEYAEYSRSVNRFIPDLRGFSKSTADMDFKWIRVILKEYGTAFAWIMAAFGLRAWCLYREEGKAALREVCILAAAVVPVMVAYVTVLVLKRSRLLTLDA